MRRARTLDNKKCIAVLSLAHLGIALATLRPHSECSGAVAIDVGNTFTRAAILSNECTIPEDIGCRWNTQWPPTQWLAAQHRQIGPCLSADCGQANVQDCPEPDAEVQTLDLLERFKQIKNWADTKSSRHLSHAIIAIPWSTEPRNTIREAALRAGFVTSEVVWHPIAAYLGQSDPPQTDRVVVVVHVGGCTTEVTVIRWEEGVAEIFGHGAEHFGGHALNQRLLEWARKEITLVSGAQLAVDDSALKVEVERAKLQLSLRGAGPVLLSTRNAGEVLHLPLTHQDLEKIWNSELQMMSALVRKTLEEALPRLRDEKTTVSIDEVLVVGGSAHLPQVKEAIERAVGRPLALSASKPDLSKICGAAKLAVDRLQQRCTDARQHDELLEHMADVLPLALGFKVPGSGSLHTVLPRNSLVGWRDGLTRSVVLPAPNATAVRIDVTWAHAAASKCLPLATLFLDLPSLDEAETPRNLNVTMHASADGDLTVSAAVRAEAQQRVFVPGCLRLPPDLIERVLAEGEHQSEDLESRERKIEELCRLLDAESTFRDEL